MQENKNRNEQYSKSNRKAANLAIEKKDPSRNIWYLWNLWTQIKWNNKVTLLRRKSVYFAPLLAFMTTHRERSN